VLECRLKVASGVYALRQVLFRDGSRNQRIFQLTLDAIYALSPNWRSKDINTILILPISTHTLRIWITPNISPKLKAYKFEFLPRLRRWKLKQH
jgi:hypothetical protein